MEELKWRGLIHDIIPGTEKQLQKEKTTIYLGFDPTSDALHVGNLLPIILLVHLYKLGHNPIILIGGATAMIGDPSGKLYERDLLDEKKINQNIKGIKNNLLNFNFFLNRKYIPLILNNYKWIKNISFLSFIRDIGKKVTINYMMSKDSVKNRLSKGINHGMSFTEFTYQLIQGFDFYYLNKNYNCKIQIGGSDQWGNITIGTDLIKKININKKEAFAITCPLITHPNGLKFGKSETGNIWLDKKKTSTYLFYQFWMKTSDKLAEKYIKLFTFLSKEKINTLIQSHYKEPNRFLLQKQIAKEITIFIHGKEEFKKAMQASEILFGKKNQISILDMDKKTFLSIFNGLPIKLIKQKKNFSISIIDFLLNSQYFSSKNEIKRMLKENSLSINKIKNISQDFYINESNLIDKKYVLIEKGKKNKFIIELILN